MKKIIALSAILISFSILIVASILFSHYIDYNIGNASFMILIICFIIVLMMVIDQATPTNGKLKDKE